MVMIKYNVVDTKGKAAGNIELDSNVFDRPYNESLIHQVVVAQLANKRQGTKCTLTRAEVRGGGIKPWRQKGTGRARSGSNRSPIWRHGGVVFAPKPRDFSKKVNAKMKAAAICSALSQKVREGNLIILKDMDIAEPKTKVFVEVLKNIGVTKTALVLTFGNSAETVYRTGKNIEGINLMDVSLVNVYDVLRAEKCVLTKDGVKAITEVYA
jgi:large subunit ribosomal protein L4